MPDLADGESTEMKGSAAKPYTIKNVGGVYSCSCPAWRNQSLAIERRTCKHIRRLRGDQAELDRIGGELPAKSTKEKKKKTDSPPLLLAQKWDNAADLTDWWMSEKLDGVRAFWDGKQFLSRQGNQYHAPDWFLKGLPKMPLDGELWLDRRKFQRTVSIVRRQDKSDHWKEIRFVVFDAPHVEGDFENRLKELAESIQEENPYLSLLDHTRCEGSKHLQKELARIESLGGEGLMLRQPGSCYEVGRSSTLLKVKNFHDDEAIVLDHQPGKGKHKGRLGALNVQLKDGTEFSVGTGFSDAQRNAPPPIGSSITFRYQELSDAGVPRFPSFVRVRKRANPAADDDRITTTISPNRATKMKKTVKKVKRKVVAKAKKQTATKAKKKTATKAKKKTVVKAKKKTVVKAKKQTATKAKKKTATKAKKKTVVKAKKKTATKAKKKTVAKAKKVSMTNSSSDQNEGLRYFEFVEGKSNKFWEISTDGCDVTVRYGRIGANGTTKTKDFANEEAAFAHAQKLIEQKTEKGYEETTPE